MPRLYFESPTSAIGSDEALALPSPRGGGWRILLLTAVLLGGILGGAFLQRMPDEKEAMSAREMISRHAAREGRLIIAYFSGRDCPACTKMERDAWADEAIREIVQRSFLLWSLDPDDPSYRKLTEEYRITAPPAVVITSAEGRVLTSESGEPRRHIGYLSTEDLRGILESAQAGRMVEKPRTERATWRERRRAVEAVDG